MDCSLSTYFTQLAHQLKLIKRMQPDQHLFYHSEEKKIHVGQNLPLALAPYKPDITAPSLELFRTDIVKELEKFDLTSSLHTVIEKVNSCMNHLLQFPSFPHDKRQKIFYSFAQNILALFQKKIFHSLPSEEPTVPVYSFPSLRYMKVKYQGAGNVGSYSALSPRSLKKFTIYTATEGRRFGWVLGERLTLKLQSIDK